MVAEAGAEAETVGGGGRDQEAREEVRAEPEKHQPSPGGAKGTGHLGSPVFSLSRPWVRGPFAAGSQGLHLLSLMGKAAGSTYVSI